MPRRCAVPGCGKTTCLNTLPKDPDVKEKWVQFIFSKRPSHVSVNAHVCSVHFTDDCFENKLQYDAGFARTLSLRNQAVPTILDPTTPLPTSPSCSGPVFKDVGCQTDQPTQTSVGTQLSFQTLRPKYRSKETQTKQSTKLSGVDATIPWTTSQIFTSTPLKDERPAKRRRFELDEGEESVSFEEVWDTQDVKYTPSQSVPSVTEPSKHSMYASKASHEDTKYIVFENCLLELFETCPVCSRACDIHPHSNGSFVAIDQLCSHCKYFRKWKSQPCFGSTPVGNLQLSASLYFTGASFFQIKKVFESMHLKMLKYRTFRRHASMYLEPLIIYKWKKEQEDLVKDLCEADKVIIGGDMRGRSAKYGSYTTMDLQNNLIIDIQLVQSSEVGGSYHMEKEGLKRSLEWLEACGVRLDCIVTDRHPQIQKFLKERNVTQYYDVWHLEKGLSKKLKQIARDKDCSIVKKWQHSIRNHLYWTAASSTSGPEKVAKWKSLVNHIQDVHIHEDPSYPKCEHPHGVSKDSSKWFKPGTKALYKVEKLLTNKRVLKDVAKLSPHYQTSSLEAFHGVILRFAPKTVVFPFIGKLCRLYLAGMHFNENSNRPKAKTSSGKPIYRLLFPKAKKGSYTTKPLTSNPTYCYVYNLMTLLFEKVLPDPFPYMEELHKITEPERLCAHYDRPSLEKAIAGHVSRFSRGAD